MPAGRSRFATALRRAPLRAAISAATGINLPLPRKRAPNIAACTYSASMGGSILYPAEEYINPAEGTIECWYRPAFENTERGVPFAERKQTTNYGIFMLRWGDDIGGGSNCGFYWNAQVQGPVAWSRKDGKVLTNPAAAFDWKAGQWYHLALTWSDKVRLYVDGEKVAEADNPGFIPGPLENAQMLIGGTSPLCTIDELRILSVARPPAPNPGEYQPDAETLLLDHFEGYETKGAETPGSAETHTSFGPGKFGRAVTWDPRDSKTELQRLAQISAADSRILTEMAEADAQKVLRSQGEGYWQLDAHETRALGKDRLANLLRWLLDRFSDGDHEFSFEDIQRRTGDPIQV